MSLLGGWNLIPLGAREPRAREHSAWKSAVRQLTSSARRYPNGAGLFAAGLGQRRPQPGDLRLVDLVYVSAQCRHLLAHVRERLLDDGVGGQLRQVGQRERV